MPASGPVEERGDLGVCAKTNHKMEGRGERKREKEGGEGEGGRPVEEEEEEELGVSQSMG